jgi:hypothetical protein
LIIVLFTSLYKILMLVYTKFTYMFYSFKFIVIFNSYILIRLRN